MRAISSVPQGKQFRLLTLNRAALAYLSVFMYSAIAVACPSVNPEMPLL
jgi:hypothetical protein